LSPPSVRAEWGAGRISLSSLGIEERGRGKRRRKVRGTNVGCCYIGWYGVRRGRKRMRMTVPLPLVASPVLLIRLGRGSGIVC
jgi:hypothetical protein